MDNIKTWTGLSAEESIRMTEDRDKWRGYTESAEQSRTAEQNKISKLTVKLQIILEIVRSWCGQPSDRGRLKNRTEQYTVCLVYLVRNTMFK